MPSAIEPSPIAIDHSLPGPLHVQITNRLRSAIAEGKLAPGARLPSARAMAETLGVARGTVDAGYRLLTREGILLSRGSGGTVVSPELAAQPAPPAQRRMRLSQPRPDPGDGMLPFRPGLPALDAFPYKLWASLAARAGRMLDAEALGQPDPAGWRGLREAIAAWLAAARGIACAPGQIVVTAGFRGALALAMRVLVRPGDTVWVEDPGYPPVRQALEAGGAVPVPVRVDSEGLRVAAAAISAPRARLAVVTPAQQDPLGVSLRLPRRLELLARAAEADMMVLENDRDSVLRYDGHPLPALKSLDRSGRVLYAAGFSKLLFPALRLGCLVVPDALAEAFVRASRLCSFGLPPLDQRVLAAFMAEGHFARHLRRMRALYAARREALADALRTTFGDRVDLDLLPGGTHLIARFPGGPDDGVLTRRAAAAGLGPVSLSGLAAAHAGGQGLLVGFASLPEQEAPAMVRRLAEALDLGGPVARMSGGVPDPVAGLIGPAR